MTRIFSILLLALAALTVNAAEPDITFEELTFDFGTIAEDGGPVKHEFKFTNNGDATASCGCTRPDFPKKPVAAGKKGVLKVTYLPKGRPGEFNKTVTVKTNSKKHKKVTLRIKGFVTPES